MATLELKKIVKNYGNLEFVIGLGNWFLVGLGNFVGISGSYWLGGYF